MLSGLHVISSVSIPCGISYLRYYPARLCSIAVATVILEHPVAYVAAVVCVCVAPDAYVYLPYRLFIAVQCYVIDVSRQIALLL